MMVVVVVLMVGVDEFGGSCKYSDSGETVDSVETVDFSETDVFGYSEFIEF